MTQEKKSSSDTMDYLKQVSVKHHFSIATCIYNPHIQYLTLTLSKFQHTLQKKKVPQNSDTVYSITN